ncbi:MAG: asparagine--tRNA ligase [Elusimicrobia bacterium GWA2_69_24]|nr:MAG: asparagine--tRNA ligase [Elusimicrobia bacterium GWA2_69_24]HBL15957.1 asparagine--tRNA ligase [Elusimicrobiota bacterium]
MERTLIKDALKQTPGTRLTVAGWVRTLRCSKGGFSFITLNDGSCMASIQVVADGQLANYDSEVVRLTAGCSLRIQGELVQSPGKGQAVELKAAAVSVLGTADAQTYPIQPKHHTLEFLRSVAHLRPRTNTFGAVARVRNAVCWAIHEFFQKRGFLYVHTPIVTASDCEGAGQMFRVTTLDLEKLPRGPEGKVDYGQDFFARPTFLTVSGQLEGEAYACALGDIYTFGPTFRSEDSTTPRHLSEFWMIEPEMAFCDLKGDADLAEAFLKHIFSAVLERCSEDMDFFCARQDKTLRDTLKGIIDSEFVRLEYTEAVSILEQAGRKWEFPIQWGVDLQTEHERYLSEEKFQKPVILQNYPAKIKSFYMRLNDDAAEHGGESTVAALDVLVPKIGEIIGGSQREERLDRIAARMAGLDMKPEDYWWYLDLRRYGTVPHAGFGLGLERTVQFVTGTANIRDVIPFPRAPRSAEF